MHNSKKIRNFRQQRREKLESLVWSAQIEFNGMYNTHNKGEFYKVVFEKDYAGHDEFILLARTDPLINHGKPEPEFIPFESLFYADN